MHIELFDVYKIGIGPSSSHTFGPMVVAFLFLKTLKEKKLEKTTQIMAKLLYDSLCATQGKGI